MIAETTDLIGSTLRLSTPLLFAATAGILCERSGIATICLEGTMLLGAWTAAAVTYLTGQPHLGIVAGLTAGAVAMALHAFLTIEAKANAIISGVAVNLLATGLTPLLTKLFFGNPTNTPSIPLDNRLREWSVPLLSQIPEIGSVFFSQPVLIYCALILPFLVHAFLFHTGLGLRLLAAGDGPEALETVGVSPRKVRWLALLTGGALAGLGGTYLSISHASGFTREMTAGRGYIALTALIFGKWRPLPTLLTCLFFALFDALQIRLQSNTFFGFELPVQFVQSLPYLVALVVLAGFIGKANPPLAISKT